MTTGRKLASAGVLLRATFGIAAIVAIFVGMNDLSRRAIEASDLATTPAPEAEEPLEIVVPVGPEAVDPTLEPIFEVEVVPDPEEVTQSAT